MELDAMNQTAAGAAQQHRPERPEGQVHARRPGPGAWRRDPPEGSIVVDRSVATGRGFFPFSAGARPHDWLTLAGSIG